MTDSGSGRPRSHRAGAPATGLARRVLAPAVALLVVVAVIGILIWLNGRSTGHDTDAATVTPSAAGPVASTSSRSSPGAAATVAASPTTSPSHHSHPAPSRSAAPPPRPSRHRHSAAPASATAMAPVEVLNNSRRTGLAHVVAREVSGRGWSIYHVGNVRGRIATSTVYYAPGDAAAAAHLAHEFGSVRRVLPNSEGGFRTAGITLVLTRDWVG